MRVLRAIVLSGSSDNTIILQVLSTDDPLSTWYVNTFKIWYLDRLELRRDLISFPFTIYDLYNRIEIARFFAKFSRNFFPVVGTKNIFSNLSNLCQKSCASYDRGWSDFYEAKENGKFEIWYNIRRENSIFLENWKFENSLNRDVY